MTYTPAVVLEYLQRTGISTAQGALRIGLVLLAGYVGSPARAGVRAPRGRADAGEPAPGSAQARGDHAHHDVRRACSAR